MTPSDDVPYHGTAPEADPSIVGYYNLEDGSGDEEVLIDNRGAWGTSGDLTTASSAGTPDWTGYVRQSELPIVSPYTALPATVPGIDDDPARPPVFVELLSSAVDARYVAVDIYDPDNADGAAQIGSLGVWEAVEPTWRRPRDSFSASTHPAEISWTPSSVPVRGLGLTGRKFRVAFNVLTQAEGWEIYHWLRSAAELRTAVLLLAAGVDEDRVYWPQRSLYGIPESIGELKDRDLHTLYYSLDVTIREVAATLD